jgi:hypothetical protein
MEDIFGKLSPFLLIAMIGGLVELAKRLGISGNGSLVLSLVLGVVLGVGFQVTTEIPTSPAQWFAVMCFGLLFGLVTSGLYDLGKRLTSKPPAIDPLPVNTASARFLTSDK